MGGPPFSAHVPNPGRMEELLLHGETTGWVVPRSGPHRKTAFDLVTVRHGRSLVSVDSGLANRLLRTWLVEGGRSRWRAEVPFGDCRFDFGRMRADGRLAELVEVKSSNLRVGRTALFPDAPTVRGTHHLDVLTRATRSGIPSTVCFVVQRSDVAEFAPNRALDPEFGRAFDRAARAGVRMRALRLRMRPEGATFAGWMPVRLGALPKRI